MFLIMMLLSFLSVCNENYNEGKKLFLCSRVRGNQDRFLKLYHFAYQWTKINPMAWMLFSPLSDSGVASLPHVLESSGYPPVPNPILESQELHMLALFPRMPILAFVEEAVHLELKPSWLHWSCKEASEPINFFHVLRPSEVARYWPSAMSEYRELAVWLITMKLICWPIFIPRQIWEKDVFQ